MKPQCLHPISCLNRKGEGAPIVQRIFCVLVRIIYAMGKYNHLLMDSFLELVQPRTCDETIYHNRKILFGASLFIMATGYESSSSSSGSKPANFCE